MQELKVSTNDEGQRLNKYLSKYLKQAPSSFIYKMLRKKNIVLNDKKAKGDEIISYGDSIKLYLSDETIEKFTGNNSTCNFSDTSAKEKSNNITATDKRNIIALEVLYRDDNIMAVNKPVGVLSQKAVAADYSINEAIIDYCLDKQILSKEDMLTFKPSVCNRLDRNTSGIILAGISLKGSQYLSEKLKARDADKYYFTIVKGVFCEEKKASAYIKKDGDTNTSAIIEQDNLNILPKNEQKKYSKIETAFIPVSANKNYTLLKVKLITGKTHQIRAHLSYLGFPVIGDSKYGDVSTNRIFRDRYKLKNHLLHSGELYLDNLRIVAPLTEQFKKICQGEKLNYSLISKGE